MELSDEDQDRMTRAVVRLNPRGESEGPMAYVMRIALLSGLVEPGDEPVTKMPEATVRPAPQQEIRKPYKDDVDDGDDMADLI